MRGLKRHLLSMDSMLGKRLNKRGRRYCIKSSNSAIFDPRFLRKARKCWVRDMILMVTVTYHPQFQINLWICMKTHKDVKKDKTKYIQHAWSQNAHSNLTLTRLSTTIRNSRLGILVINRKDLILGIEVKSKWLLLITIYLIQKVVNHFSSQK